MIQDEETQRSDEPDVGLRLLEQVHGPLLGTPTLWRVLGFNSGEAFRKALQRRKLPVPVFQLPHRRGRFAHTRQVVEWLRGVSSTKAPIETHEAKENP